MPRNDQVTRQWHLLRRLEGSQGATLQDLVSSLPDDFPKNPRTIRRDLESLEFAGFPIVTDQINGRTRWKLMEGFRDIPALGFSATELMALVFSCNLLKPLEGTEIQASLSGRTRWKLMEGFRDIPALGFCATELMALVFSRNLLKPLEGTEIQASLSSALNKAAAALPPQGHEYVRDLEKVFSVGLGPHKSYRQHRETIDRISQGIAQTKTAQIRYYSASRSAATRREVDPYRLWYAAGGLYLIAYCHLRKDVRMFAVERIRSITLTDHPYQLPLGFNVEEYVQDALMVMRGRRIDVELIFSKTAAAWVKDTTWHVSQETAMLKDGRLKMTLKVADTDELSDGS
jgi:predicted DNA-binding transcriptional regulator YafY